MRKIFLLVIILKLYLITEAQDNGTSAEWGYIPRKDTTQYRPKLIPKDTTEYLKYEDSAVRLYKTKVISKPLSQKQLKDYFEDWAALAFVNYNSVNSGETDNQIVIKYKEELSVVETYKQGEKKVRKIVGTKRNGKKKYKKVLEPVYNQKSFKKTFDITLAAQFKDGKMRVMFYDKSGVYNKFINEWEFSIGNTLSAIENFFYDKKSSMNW